jgi:putative iron-only hydrogenase system regulator
MAKRLGVVGIIVEDLSAATEVNALLHEFAALIVGRMGIPYRERGLSVISLIVDGTVEELAALTGRLGRVPNIAVKSALSRESHAAPAAHGGNHANL